MRLTEFWRRLEESFGGAYAHSLATDQTFAALNNRTIEEALSQGEEVVTVWRAVVTAYPDRVPSRLR